VRTLERPNLRLPDRLKGEADIPTIVRAVYIGLDPRLVGAAALSVLAHLEELVARGAVVTEGSPSIAGTYRLA
jgi:beta-lactamase-like protein